MKTTIIFVALGLLCIAYAFPAPSDDLAIENTKTDVDVSGDLQTDENRYYGGYRGYGNRGHYGGFGHRGYYGGFGHRGHYGGHRYGGHRYGGYYGGFHG